MRWIESPASALVAPGRRSEFLTESCGTHRQVPWMGCMGRSMDVSRGKIERHQETPLVFVRLARKNQVLRFLVGALQ